MVNYWTIALEPPFVHFYAWWSQQLGNGAYISTTGLEGVHLSPVYVYPGAVFDGWILMIFDVWFIHIATYHYIANPFGDRI